MKLNFSLLLVSLLFATVSGAAAQSNPPATLPVSPLSSELISGQISAEMFGPVSGPMSRPLSEPLSGVASPSVVRWTCNAFYLPARSIWQRMLDLELDASGVRTVQIDGVAVYAFSIQGTTVLTAIDGERIQFDVAAQTWASDLRGMVTSSGRCERQAPAP